MNISYRATELFFDRAAVRDAVNAAERRVLAQFGAFVRRVARNSMRKAPRDPARGVETYYDTRNRRRARATGRYVKRNTSRPGAPPLYHSGEPNLRTILYAYEPATHSVVVGPVGLNGAKGAAPPLLEFGGVARFREVLTPTGWRGANTPLAKEARKRGRARERVRVARVAARPFMAPAFTSGAAKFPSLWAGAVKGTYGGGLYGAGLGGVSSGGAAA